MTYQEIVDMFRAASAAVNPAGFFHHGRREDFSLQYDQPAFRNGAAGIGLLSPTPRATVNRAEQTVRYDCVLVFMKQDDHASTELDREQIVAEMDDMSNLYMDYIFQNFNVEITSEVKTPDIRQFMGTLTGVSMAITIESNLTCINENQS